MKEVRTISHNLLPPSLKDFGLTIALEDLCHKIEQSGQNITFSSFQMNERIELVLELGLYRIAQELINNAIKHANASEIHVQLINHGDMLMLMVEDNGTGFSVKEVDEKGIGLRNIGSRVKSLKGT